MKKAICIILTALLMLAAACAHTPATAPATSASAAENTGQPQAKGAIGVSFSSESAFNGDFAAELKELFKEIEYEVVVEYAQGSHDQQVDDILKLIEAEAEVVIIDPVNVDELGEAIQECDDAGIPVFNIIESINDVYGILITADYIEMGRQAAKEVKKLIEKDGEVKGSVLMLQGPYDSFLMQMMHDGFAKELPKSDQVDVACPYCDFDEAKAYSEVKKALSSATPPDAIFSQSEAMAKGAIRAVKEAGAAVKIVTIGADEEIVRAIGEQTVAAAIYISPVELAEKTSLYIQKYLKNKDAQIPKYTGLTIAKADAGNASTLISGGRKYAHFESETQNNGEDDGSDEE